MKTIIIVSGIFLSLCMAGTVSAQQEIQTTSQKYKGVDSNGVVIKHKKKHTDRNYTKADTAAATDQNDSYNKTMDRNDVNGGNNADVNNVRNPKATNH